MEQENQKESLESNQNKETIKEIHHYHERKSGLFGRLFWGLIIVFVGLAFLGQNTGILPDINLVEFFTVIWPVFIIIAGLSILSKGNILIKTISTILMILILVLLFALFIITPFSGMPNLNSWTETNQNPDIKTQQIIFQIQRR